MAIELSTAGVKLAYCVETVAGTRPTGAYTNIPNIKSIPDFNPEPDSLETTDLSQVEWKTYIPGLKDPGSSLTLTANNNAAFQTAWGALVTASNTGETSGFATWFAVVIPALTKAFFFKGMPSPLGLKAMDVSSVVEVDAYITPTGVDGWQTKVTVS